MCGPRSESDGFKLTMTSEVLAVMSSGLSTVTHEGRRGGEEARLIAMALSGSCKVRLMDVVLVGVAYVTSGGRKGLSVRMEGGELFGGGATTTTLISAVTY